MAETLLIQADPNNKPAFYPELLQQLQLLLNDEHDETAVMAICAGVLNAAFGWHWIGFYRVQGDQLLIGPYHGPLPCLRIPYGKGVCGSAWQQSRTLVVPDVEAFPGHIACSTLSRSEIVIPLRDSSGSVRAVLDIDSIKPDDFNQDDREGLEQIATLIAGCIYS